ncbi:MAG: helix-turn-helix domain-containing protein [Microlunatus sp.]
MRAVPLKLDADEVKRLTALLHAPEQTTRAYRAKVVLLASEGMRNVDIADRLELSIATVGKWRNRYAMCGIDGLADEPRPGAPRTIDRSEVIGATLLGPPPELGITHWSSRRLAARLGIGDASVARTWREYGIAPRPHGEFSFATEPELIASAVEVIGVLLCASARIIALAVPDSDPISYHEDSSDGYVEPGLRPTSPVDDAILEFVARVLAGSQDMILRLVVAGPIRQSQTQFDELATSNRRLALHTVEHPERWLNLVEVWCRLGGHNCPSSKIRTLMDGSKPITWIRQGHVSPDN